MDHWRKFLVKHLLEVAMCVLLPIKQIPQFFAVGPQMVGHKIVCHEPNWLSSCFIGTIQLWRCTSGKGIGESSNEDSPSPSKARCSESVRYMHWDLYKHYLFCYFRLATWFLLSIRRLLLCTLSHLVWTPMEAFTWRALIQPNKWRSGMCYQAPSQQCSRHRKLHVAIVWFFFGWSVCSILPTGLNFNKRYGLSSLQFYTAERKLISIMDSPSGSPSLCAVAYDEHEGQFGSIFEIPQMYFVSSSSNQISDESNISKCIVLSITHSYCTLYTSMRKRLLSSLTYTSPFKSKEVNSILSLPSSRIQMNLHQYCSPENTPSTLIQIVKVYLWINIISNKCNFLFTK